MTTRFEKLTSELQEFYPEFNVKAKEDSTLMKIINKILFFTPDFMGSFITTIGSTVYFPQRILDEPDNAALVTLTHEYVHAKDFKSFKLIPFSFLYLLPQILAPFMLFFCFLYWWLGLLLFVLFLLPLPSYSRTHFEKKGYEMSLFALNEILKEKRISDDIRAELLLKAAEKHNKAFTTSAYYFMWPFGVKKQLEESVEKILSEEILEEGEVFTEVRRALAKSK